MSVGQRLFWSAKSQSERRFRRYMYLADSKASHRLLNGEPQKTDPPKSRPTADSGASAGKEQSCANKQSGMPSMKSEFRPVRSKT